MEGSASFERTTAPDVCASPATTSTTSPRARLYALSIMSIEHPTLLARANQTPPPISRGPVSPRSAAPAVVPYNFQWLHKAGAVASCQGRSEHVGGFLPGANAA